MLASTSSLATKPRKSDLRREAILQQAVDLFDRHGYVNTSLDDVAKAVGIKREALYYYYRSRAEILLAIIGPQTAALVDGMAQVVAKELPAIEKLEGAIRNHLQRFDRHCLEMTISLRDGIMGASPEVRSAMQRVWKQYESMWTALVADGQRDGSFERIGDPKMVAFGILGMCNWLSRWYNPRKDASIEELIRTYFVMVSQGLVPRPAAQKRKPLARTTRRQAA
ncbi:MAG: TetR/AcrR family transcriptional regulator [Burkholderiaceae bacterium]